MFIFSPALSVISSYVTLFLYSFISFFSLLSSVFPLYFLHVKTILTFGTDTRGKSASKLVVMKMEQVIRKRKNNNFRIFLITCFTSCSTDLQLQPVVQWFPTWGKFPPGGKFEATRGEILIHWCTRSSLNLLTNSILK